MLIASSDETEKGRARRSYSITEAGRRALAKDRDEWREISRAVTLLLGEA